MLTPYGPIVVTQLPLGAEFRADFAYFERLNQGDMVYLIEIEQPDMAIFNANDEFSQAYNHAIQQITDWTEWCGCNRQYLIKLTATIFGSTRRYSSDYLVLKTTLIAGNRNQISNERRKRRFVARASSLDRTMTLRTYYDFLDHIYITSHTPDVRCLRYNNQTYSPIKPDDV